MQDLTNQPNISQQVTKPETARYTVTAALPYANGPVHIGHLAGVYIPADIFSRYQRLMGRDVLFVCGTDEHGVPVTIRAKKEGISVQATVDKYHQLIKESFEGLGISFDIFSRTSNLQHHQTASDFFLKLYNDGKFIEKETLQYYDTQAQQFLADRYIQGTCPNCGYDKAYGDQCENCGSTLSPEELLNPQSMLSGATPIKKSTKHWYLPLDQYEGFLRNWLLVQHADWKTNVIGQCKSWLDSGLQPRAVTRDLDWGIKVPLPDAEGKVLYVWFDAPIGYISATQEWAAANGTDWKPWWQAEDTSLVHFIGKDNIVFHCIVFPAMLEAHGGYILPTNVPANEFLNLEGNKISTSRNWAVWLHDYLLDFPGKQDALRYALCANAPETKDNDFTWKDFQARNNNELVAIFGNFVNRALVLTQKFFGGVVPAALPYTDQEVALLQQLEKAPAAIAKSIESYRFREAINTYIDLARAGNKYLAETEPWKLIKTDTAKTGAILNLALQVAANLAILGQPFMPFSSAKLATMLGLDPDAEVLKHWQNAGMSNIIAEGSYIIADTLLFDKIEDDAIAAQVDKLMATKAANEMEGKVVQPVKTAISFEDFGKLDLRVGTIVAAEVVPKTKKLLKLTIDIGIETRTVVSGIAGHFKPEDLLNKQVTYLANLAPREIKGILSEGMILMAEDKDGSLATLTPSKEIWAGGTIN